MVSSAIIDVKGSKRGLERVVYHFICEVWLGEKFSLKETLKVWLGKSCLSLYLRSVAWREDLFKRNSQSVAWKELLISED